MYVRRESIRPAAAHESALGGGREGATEGARSRLLRLDIGISKYEGFHACGSSNQFAINFSYKE